MVSGSTFKFSFTVPHNASLMTAVPWDLKLTAPEHGCKLSLSGAHPQSLFLFSSFSKNPSGSMTGLGTLESREGKKLQQIRLECFSKYGAGAKLSYINKVNILFTCLSPKHVMDSTKKCSITQ